MRVQSDRERGEKLLREEIALQEGEDDDLSNQTQPADRGDVVVRRLGDWLELSYGLCGAGTNCTCHAFRSAEWVSGRRSRFYRRVVERPDRSVLLYERLFLRAATQQWRSQSM